MSRLRVCVITGGRAEYGILYWVVRALAQDEFFDVRIIATGTHLSPQFGMTVEQIEADGLRVDERVDMQLTSDSPSGIARSMGLGLVGMVEAIQRQEPDLVLLLGDRFEILTAAQACLLVCVPIVHLSGGDVTEGAIDDAMRHAITKLSHLHFVTNDDAHRRVIQMGEQPRHVYLVGHPGLDAFTNQPVDNTAALQSYLLRPLGQHNVLVIFHPQTLPGLGIDAAQVAPGAACANVIAALRPMDDDTVFWVVMPNADEGGLRIRQCWSQWAAQDGRVVLVESLPRRWFLALMAAADLMIGNSSSALGDAPSLGLAAVNIGDRQAGRLAGSNVVSCGYEVAAIKGALDVALGLDCRGMVNPYGDGKSGPRIAAILKALPPVHGLLRKSFYNMPWPERT